MPRVLVVMPAYNRAQYIVDSIESVLGQTYKDFHLVVVDDGSTDNTETLMQGYEGKLTYIRQENSGASVARNRGASALDCEFVALMDSDDLWLPTKLAKQIEVMDRHPNVGLVCTDAVTFSGTPPSFDQSPDHVDDKSVVVEDVYAKLFRGYSIPLPSAVLRKSVYDSVGGFDPELWTSYDWDLWLKVAKGHEIARIRETLLLIRRHGGNTSWSDAFQAAKSILAKHPPIDERIPDPDEAINTILGRYCLLTLVGNTSLGNDEAASQLFQEWREYYTGSSEPIESWLKLLSSAFVDALSCGAFSKCPDNDTISDFATRLFDDPSITARAQSAVHEAFAWFYSQRSGNDSAKHARSAIAKSPRLASDRGLLKLALGIGSKPDSAHD